MGRRKNLEVTSERMEKIIKAAIKEAEATHWSSISRIEVAKRARCAESLVHYYFNPIGMLRETALHEGISRGSIPITAQAMGAFNECALTVSREQKLEALKYIGTKNGLRNISNRIS